MGAFNLQAGKRHDTDGAIAVLDGSVVVARIEAGPRQDELLQLILAAPRLRDAALAIRGFHGQAFTGRPLACDGKPIDHTLLNEANRLACEGLRIAFPQAAPASSAAHALLEALEPEILEAIAGEIGGAFEHTARADSLRDLARRQRLARIMAGAA